MSSRIWGLDFLSRKGSAALSDDDAPAQAGRKSSSRVQTLCLMKQKPHTNTSAMDNILSANYDDDASTSAELRRQHDQHDKHSSRVPEGDMSSDHIPGSARDSPAPDMDSRLISDAQRTSTDLGNCAPHESAVSTGSAGSGLHPGSHNGVSSNSPAAAEAPAAAGQPDQTHDSSTSIDGKSSTVRGTIKHAASVLEVNTGLQSATASSSEQQLPVWAAGPEGSTAAEVQQSAHSGANDSVGPTQLHNVYDVQQPNFMANMSPTAAAAAAHVGGKTPDVQALLLAELQKEAGLDTEQTARVAALLQRYGTAGLSTASSQMNPNPSNTSWPPFNPPNPLIIPGHSGGSGVSPAGLNPGAFTASSGFSGYNSLVTPAAEYTSNGISPGAFNPGMDFSGSGGFESGQNSTGNNVQSSAGNNVQSMPGGEGYMAGVTEAGFGGLGSGANAVSAGGLTSPEAVYGTDGLDVPGTAQVAVHNVPFKWCNADLEALFKQLPGYLDAQLLFHENGRSKGVGVGLFRDVGTATEACGRLSGVQADGRKLELVLMSPDNHISFSCKQVAVLGLPWEYTAADVCELIEAAAVADGDQPGDAGVQAVEVAYREDGKSEGRAIATFRTRRQAHKAITRLHGRETLAGLRMRLFYLHEQQQRQHLLSEAPQALVTAIGQLTLDAPSPATAAAVASHTFAPYKEYNAGSGGQLGQVDSDSAAVSGSGFASASGGGAVSGEEGAHSNRSSFEKDQGPVILHVSGLMESVTREQLRELFSQAGEVTKVDIPDGGRSMGYGFITFSNPQAAEQAMLLFNNYPLGGGAIHVAYSTSATAKARQQALRQARKATLAATGRASLDGRGTAGGDGASALRLGVKPGTPHGATGTTTAGTLSGSMPLRRSFQGGVSFDGISGGMSSIEALLGNSIAAPSRHSFDHPGFASPGLRGRMGAGSATAGGLFGATAGPIRGHSSFTGVAGLTPAQLQQLQLLQAAGGAGASLDTNLNLEQLLMQLAAADPASLGAGMGAPPAFGVPGTPTHPGSIGAPSPVGALGGAGSLFGAPGRAAAAAGMFGGNAHSFASQGAGMGTGSGMGLPAGLFPQTAAGPQGLGGMGPMASLGMPGMPVSSPAAAAFGGGPLGGLADVGGGQQAGNRSVVVTGLPLGLDESQVVQLFQICGVVQNIHKPADSEVAIITFDSPTGAARAIEALDGTNMPSGGRLSVRAAFPGANDTSSNALGTFPTASGFNGMGNSRPEGAHPWEIVAPGLGDSNIFSQGSNVVGFGLAQAGASGGLRPEGNDMSGYGMSGSGLGVWGDGGYGGGKPPAPIYPGGFRQGANRSPSPGVAVSTALGLAGGVNGHGIPPTANRPSVGILASPGNSGDLFKRSGGAMSGSAGGSSALLSGGAGIEGLGLIAGMALGSTEQQGMDSAGNNAMMMLPADVMAGESDNGVQHMLSPAGDAGAALKHGVGSWSNMSGQQYYASAENGSEM